MCKKRQNFENNIDILFPIGSFYCTHAGHFVYVYCLWDGQTYISRPRPTAMYQWFQQNLVYFEKHPFRIEDLPIIFDGDNE